ncbi:MAG: putative metal-binding motif-containing protein [Alphaproteobacteria bacterium]|nr:putative metal-binding motif-containing protein [Alphaproteobacteria bacterium]
MRLLPLLLIVACGDKDGADDSGTPQDTDDEQADTSPPEDTGFPYVDDLDQDGSPRGEDCDDLNPAIFPGAEETCDGVDEDCDSAVDEGLMATWYLDIDRDGHGGADYTLETCAPPEGWVSSSDDCDDTDFTVHPDAFEVCDDDVDNDCDGEDDACPPEPGACSDFMPVDNVGMALDFYDSGSGGEYTRWDIDYTGASTWDGYEVWLTVETGTYVCDCDFFAQWTRTLAWTCEVDGVHLVYEDMESTINSHGISSTSETFTEYGGRPLVVPLTIESGTTWRVEGVRPQGGLYHSYPAQSGGVWHIQTTERDREVEAGTWYAHRIMTLDDSGNTDSYWIAEGVGIIRDIAGWEPRTISGI